MKSFPIEINVITMRVGSKIRQPSMEQVSSIYEGVGFGYKYRPPLILAITVLEESFLITVVAGF